LEAEAFERPVGPGQGGRNLEGRPNPAVHVIGFRESCGTANAVVLRPAHGPKPALPLGRQLDGDAPTVVLGSSSSDQARINHRSDELADGRPRDAQEAGNLAGALAFMVPQETKHLGLRSGQRFGYSRRNRVAFQDPVDGPRDHKESLQQPIDFILGQY